MYPAPFEYHRPATLDEVFALIAEHGDAVKLVAGGMSLIPSMKVRMIRPDHLVDLSAIEAMKGVSVDGDILRVGAMTTHWQVASSPVVARHVPLLGAVASVIADQQVRNRGTMGGSLCNNDPNADYPAAILALDASLRCAGPDGERIVKADDWILGIFTTDLAEGEVLQDISYPVQPPHVRSAYLKLRHPASRFAVVGVAVVLDADDSGICRSLRIGITGAGSNAVRAFAVEDALTGETLTAAGIAAACEQACEGLDINKDIHFTAEDRRELCRNSVERAINAAWRADCGTAALI